MAAIPETVRKTRLSAADWEQAALEMIAEKGVNAVAVEPLARRLNCTKGSFYWHFNSRDELVIAALERWEAGDREELARIMAARIRPGERLRELFLAGSRGSLIHTVYSALFAAGGDARVAPIMEQVTDRRLDYLIEAFEDLGLDATDARHRARLTYSAYVGFLQLARQRRGTHMHADEYEAYVAHMMRTLIPDQSVV